MKIGIMGAGAIGTLYGGMLAASGTDTVIYVKPGPKYDILKKKGKLEIIFPGNRTIESNPLITDSLTGLSECDFLILCVKSYSTEKAAAMASEAVKKSCIIVSFQNGLGNIEAIKRYFPENRISAGTTSEGSFLKGPGIAVHGGKGVTSISMLDKNNSCLEKFAEAMNYAGFKCKIDPDYMKLIWKKLIVNAAINPLTALENVSNKYICSSPYLKKIAEKIIEEGIKCAEAEEIFLSFKEMADTVFTTAEKTGDNISSMLQDIRGGRTTEIDHISGAIEKRGIKYGIETKTNSAMKNLVKAKEEINNEQKKG